jgi:hypothetical protein
MTSPTDATIKELTRADTQTLYETLGAYASTYPKDPARFAAVGSVVPADVKFAGPLDDAAELGKRILRRWNKVLCDLACGSGDDIDPAARKSILAAVEIGSPEAIAAAITGVLISVFSVGPAIAAVVGVLLGKVLLPAAGKEVCTFWKERL